MVTVIIAAHGHLAPALIDSAAMIMGSRTGSSRSRSTRPRGRTTCSPSTRRRLRERPSSSWTSSGSPYNAAARFAAAREDTDIVTGVSLAMLIEVLGKRRGSADIAKLVATAKKAGAAGVRVFSEVYTKPTTSVTDDDEGDEL